MGCERECGQRHGESLIAARACILDECADATVSTSVSMLSVPAAAEPARGQPIDGTSLFYPCRGQDP
jgi:hypothetical protein